MLHLFVGSSPYIVSVPNCIMIKTPLCFASSAWHVQFLMNMIFLDQQSYTKIIVTVCKLQNNNGVQTSK